MLVESPTKCAKIKHILAELGYKKVTVMATLGHTTNIKDNRKSYKNTGIYPEQEFKADYEVMPDKIKLVNQIKEAAKASDLVLIASDPDREGESLGNQIKNILKLSEDKYYRVVYHSITKAAIQEAFENPIKMNKNLIAAAESRQILDKLLGYALSPIARNYLGCKSVGRAQSVGLKLVADRENEINAFIPETYYELYLKFIKNGIDFKAKYIGTDQQKISRLTSLDEVDDIRHACKGSYIVDEVEKKTKLENPKPPFCTSSIQQECSSKLGYKVKDIMALCQKLFEGGYITYHRSDSTEFSEDFTNQLRAFVNANYNNSYTNPKVGKKTGFEQEGHECIRVTDLNLTPDLFAEKVISMQQNKIYSLIWKRTVASVLPPAKIAETNYYIKNNNQRFLLQSNELIDAGYRAVYSDADKEDYRLATEIFSKDEVLSDCSLIKECKETQPPARYSESSLVKALETAGVGRPSTFATIVETILSDMRGYAKLENKKIVPTEKGLMLAAYLDRNFSNLINLNYTREMEENLDLIASGKLTKLKFLTDFFNTLETAIKNNTETGLKADEDRLCPNCGSTLVLKRSRKGQLFYACPSYPDCKYTESANR